MLGAMMIDNRLADDLVVLLERRGKGARRLELALFRVDGAARRFNLDFYCKAFGIESPKSHGVTGMDVVAKAGSDAHVMGLTSASAGATSAAPG